MEYCRSPDGVTSVSVRPYYATMLSRVYLALAMGFLVYRLYHPSSSWLRANSATPADLIKVALISGRT